MKKWNLYTTNEIKACGWLKKQLEIQAAGLSGNLDKVYRDIRDSAWIGGDAEGWERVPYWLDGFIPLAYLLEDDDMILRAKKYIEAILLRQNEDGWICPCLEEERPTYDSWPVQLITKVLTVYYECAGDERIPNVIYRVLKNYYQLLSSGTIELFNWGKWRWYETFIALNFLKERYDEQWIVDLATILKEQGINYQEYTHLWKTPLYKVEWGTHIVGIAMQMKSEAVSHELLGEEYKDEAEEHYQLLKKYNGTPVELFTGDEHLAGLSPIQGSELCSVVELMYSYELLYAYTGDKKWAERLEVLAFNALPATISDDMWTHQYDQLSNQIACITFPGKPIFSTNRANSHIFGLEPNYGCCTANFNQGWPKLALSTFMHNDDTVINVIPIPSELKTDDKYILLETNYPFENSFHYTIEAQKDFTFKVRIPSFAENLKVNGNQTDGDEISFVIKEGEKLELDIEFDVVPYFEKRPYNLHTAKCGSLVFSLPIKYGKNMFENEELGVKYPHCDYEYVPLSDWNYAYCDTTLTVEPRTVSDIPFSSETPPIVIKANMKKIDWGFETGYDSVCAKVPKSTEPIGEAEEIELYPYGCAKLRMTEIPIIN